MTGGQVVLSLGPFGACSRPSGSPSDPQLIASLDSPPYSALTTFSPGSGSWLICQDLGNLP